MTTINDVARVAGVSVSTVSRILNNKSDVADSTRLHVLEVIDQLGYRPHAQARRLRTDSRRSNTISLLYPLENTPFDNIVNSSLLIDYIQGISKGIEECGFQLNLITSNTTEEKLLNAYRSSQIDGAIIMQVTIHDERVQALRKTGYPFIMIGRCGDNNGISYVDFDYRRGVITAFEHLQTAGHKRIGFLTFPQILIEQEYGPAYYAMRGYDVVSNQTDLYTPYTTCDINMQSTISTTQSLLMEYPDLTALVVVHGEYLSGIVTGLSQANRTIPDDISVVVIANKGQTEMVSPNITRVDVPAMNSGYRAARLLIAQIETHTSTVHQFLCDTRIYEGNSVRTLNSGEMYR